MQQYLIQSGKGVTSELVYKAWRLLNPANEEKDTLARGINLAKPQPPAALELEVRGLVSGEQSLEFGKGHSRALNAMC